MQRPICIGYYNSKMGGIDVKDMRRMWIPIVLTGQHRWWIKLWCTALDETGQNGMIIYNKSNDKNINIMDFKSTLIHSTLGSRLFPIDRSLPDPQIGIAAAHAVSTLKRDRLVPMIKEDGKTYQAKCVYCLFINKESNKTRACCLCCELPYCVEASTGRQCHAIVHQSKEKLTYYINIFTPKHAKKRKHKEITYYEQPGVVPLLGKPKKETI